MKKLLGLLGLLLACYPLSAQTTLQTSFETSEGYNAAALHGQKGWTATNGTAVVNTAKAKTGTQSVQLTANNTALLCNYIAFSGAVPGINGDVYADLWVNPASFITKGLTINGYDLYGGSEKRVFVVEFTTDNKIKGYSGSSGSNIGVWAANQWVRISVKMDFAAEKYKVAIDGAVSATEFNFRETYTPTASGTRVAGVKEFHSLRFNHSSDAQVATSDAAVDDIYLGKTPIANVSFGASSTTRTITVTQPAFGSIALNPATGPYTLVNRLQPRLPCHRAMPTAAGRATCLAPGSCRTLPSMGIWLSAPVWPLTRTIRHHNTPLPSTNRPTALSPCLLLRPAMCITKKPLSLRR